MTAPVTPITPNSTLGSPLSIQSQATLVNDLRNNSISLEKDPIRDQSSSASLVLEKLQAILEPDELSETLGTIPNIVVIGMESAGKSSVALTNVPLHIAGRTATRYPMRIASTKTPGKRFQATIYIEANCSDGSIKRNLFARSLTQLVNLREAIRLAGNEARRMEIEGIARTWDELLPISDAQQLDSSDEWPEYTMNTVVLNISGPDQHDLHMIDLPGVGQKSTSDAVINLIQHYVQKKENIIVHCMAASGSAPTADKCVDLNVNADPSGNRTMVVMTKVDRIEDLDDNLWIDMITRRADRFDGWSPKLGIYPVRLAGPKEIKAGLGPAQVQSVERNLFASGNWSDIVKKSGLPGFGIHVARQKVLGLHSDRINDWLKTIPNLLGKKRQVVAESTSLLPPLPENAITALHDEVIGPFAFKLRKELVVRGETHTDLAKLQKTLIKDLGSCLPAVIPLFKKDESKQTLLRTEMGRPMCEGVTSEQSKLWTDDIIRLRDEYRSPRNGKCDDAEILACIIRDALASCRRIVDAHIEAVWNLVAGSVSRLAGVRAGPRNTIVQAMTSLQEITVLKTVNFSKDALEIGASDPALTAVQGESFVKGLRCTARYTVENFDRIYRPSPPSPGKTTQAYAPIPIPAKVSEEDIKDALRLQSEIDIHVGLAVYRIGTMIGQKVQVDIPGMLDQVESKLRIAFQLDQVDESVKKRSRGLFESSNDRIKRAKLIQKERSLSEVEFIVREAIEQ